jgi:hypothetical protein
MTAWRWPFTGVFSSWPVSASRGPIEVISELFVELR